jgi:hypothetical protein
MTSATSSAALDVMPASRCPTAQETGASGAGCREADALRGSENRSLVAAGLSAVCIETRRAKAAMVRCRTRPTATTRVAWPDRPDRVVPGRAREEPGLPILARPAGRTPAGVKQDARCRERPASLLREAKLKLGTPARKEFAARVRELTAADPVLSVLAEPLLTIMR